MQLKMLSPDAWIVMQLADRAGATVCSRVIQRDGEMSLQPLDLKRERWLRQTQMPSGPTHGSGLRRLEKCPQEGGVQPVL